MAERATVRVAIRAWLPLILLAGWVVPNAVLAADDEVAIEEEPAAAAPAASQTAPAATPTSPGETTAAAPGSSTGNPDEVAVTEDEPAAAPTASAQPGTTAPEPAAGEAPAPAADTAAAVAAPAPPAEPPPSAETASDEAPAAAAGPDVVTPPEPPAAAAAPEAAGAGEPTEESLEPETPAAPESPDAEVSLDDETPGAPVAAAPEPPVAVEESAPIVVTPRLEPAAPTRPIVWSSRAQAAAFDDFVRSGVPLSAGPVRFPASVSGPLDEATPVAAPSEDVLVDGIYPRGMMFAVYRIVPESCSAHYVGVLAIRKPVGGGRSRGTVLKAEDVVEPGDSLVPLDALRSEYERQASRQSGMAALEATVGCFASGATTSAAMRDAVILDRGAADGVGLGWFCEFTMPGQEQNLTYGRVVRVGPHACTVMLIRLYEPVQVGDRARLSSGVPAAGAKASRH